MHVLSKIPKETRKKFIAKQTVYHNGRLATVLYEVTKKGEEGYRIRNNQGMEVVARSRELSPHQGPTTLQTNTSW